MFSKKLLSISLAFMFVISGACLVGAVSHTEYVGMVAAGDTPTENITEMIDGLVPSFILLVFVMVFMIMLLTIVDRVGKK